MILQALVEHYEDLAAQGKLARPGWSDANISYALYINNAGELEKDRKSTRLNSSHANI